MFDNARDITKVRPRLVVVRSQTGKPDMRSAAAQVSLSGRTLSRMPRLDGRTTSSLRQSLSTMHAWLRDEGMQEARTREDHIALAQFMAMQAASMTPDEVSCVNEYLFGAGDGRPQHSHNLPRAPIERPETKVA